MAQNGYKECCRGNHTDKAIELLLEAICLLRAAADEEVLIPQPDMVRPDYEEIGWGVGDQHLMPIEDVDYLVLHHDGSPVHVNKTAIQIHRYHYEVKGWAGIGYHGWIEWTGLIATGRSLQHRGAHAGQAYNKRSWAAGLAGNYSLAEDVPAAQWEAAVHLFAYWQQLRPGAQIVGHRELPGAGEPHCPGEHFDMDLFRAAVHDRGGGG